MTPNIDPLLLNWLHSFKKTKQRPLRVLHIGNIANNAYINAKIQRKIGIEAYVIAEMDKYIMDTPEWEDADFEEGWGDDDFNPKWGNVNLGEYQRPNWFITGSLISCLAQVDALCSKKQLTFMKKSKFYFGNIVFIAQETIRHFLKGLWHLLWKLLTTLFQISKLFLSSIISCLGGFLNIIRTSSILFISGVLATFEIPINKSRLYKLYLNIKKYKQDLKTYLAKKRSVKYSPSNQDPLTSTHTFAELSLVAEFQNFFPNRKDKLVSEDFLPFVIPFQIWNNIFSYFDLVQCYGIHPIFCLGSKNIRYVAFEHGTLRDFTLKDDSLCRLTALAYRKANHTFISNGDCLEYAQKLNLEPFSPTIHPLDFEPFEKVTPEDIASIRKLYGAEILLFCPTRHDWDIKGTDIVIKSLPHILAHTNKSVTLLLSEWGKEVSKSKQLIKELNLEPYVRWIRPLPRVRLAKYLKASDVALDQMVLPCFGGISPQSIAAGTPVIMSYKPESTSWMFPEPAPILPAFSSEEICNQVLKALDPEWRKSFDAQAKNWINKYHSPTVLLNQHLEVYKDILEAEDKS